MPGGANLCQEKSEGQNIWKQGSGETTLILPLHLAASPGTCFFVLFCFPGSALSSFTKGMKFDFEDNKGDKTAGRISVHMWVFFPNLELIASFC